VAIAEYSGNMIDFSRVIRNRGSPNVPLPRSWRWPSQLLTYEQKKEPFLSGNEDLPKKCASVSVIFPAFNEEHNIRTTIEFAKRVLANLAETWEIILVDDGSQDATGAICDELAALDQQVQTIHHSSNLGYGAALKSGIILAQHDLIFFTDSDGQFDLRELRQLIRWSKEYDIVAGYRGKRRDPFYRSLNAFGWNALVRLVLGLNVRDIDCAFKLFHREVFSHVQIRSVGAMVNTEILAQATRFGMRIREVEVTHFPRRYGRASGANTRVILKAFRELIRLAHDLRWVPQDQRGITPPLQRK
jgi:glycosyltransferase involved in cell wall biosynthesis